MKLGVDYDGNTGDRQLKRLMYFDVEGNRVEALQEYTHTAEHLLTSALAMGPWMGHGCRHAYPNPRPRRGLSLGRPKLLPAAALSCNDDVVTRW